MKNQDFPKVLNRQNLGAWNAVIAVITKVLGKKRSEDYEQLVIDMMEAYRVIDVHMSLKIHLMHFHMNYFSQQLSTESDEQGERYHQVALPFEAR